MKYCSSVLQHYIQSTNPHPGLKIHSHVLKAGYAKNTNILIKILILHLRTGCLTYARQVFDELPRPTLSAFNYLIGGYLRQGKVEDSLQLVREIFRVGQTPDAFTLSMVLKAFVRNCGSSIPRAVHGHVLRSCVEVDHVLSRALVFSYATRGNMLSARRVFDSTVREDAASSTALISGYMNHGQIPSAEDIFSRVKSKDVVIFNAMIEGYSNSADNSRKAINIYSQMQELGFSPSLSTFSSLIGACSIMGDISVNQQLHSQLLKREFSTDVKMGSALIDMYSKCGRTTDARKVFDEMAEKNVFSWTSMIYGYGRNGRSEDALELFERMKEFGMAPNGVTYLGALVACAHGGLMAEGRALFESMKREHPMSLKSEHFACMVDLLGRGGCVEEAWDFVMEMPVKPTYDVWNALLSACSVHGEVEMARNVASQIFKLSGGKEKVAAAWVSLSNAYASARKWEYVDAVREVMHSTGKRKSAGCSWG